MGTCDHRARVLILCTGNSCRSQMAEGLLRYLDDDRFEVRSAGSDPSGHVHPMAIEAMAEFGLDISDHRSESMNQFINESFDYVITVCDDAAEACPVFPGPAKQIHWSFDDPAKAQGTEEERMAVFRRVRDEIHDQLEAFCEATA